MDLKVPFWRSVQFAYSMVLLIGLIFFAGLLIFTQNYRQDQNQMIYDDRKTERKKHFDNVVRLESQSLVDITEENTYWDDMVNFIAKPDPEFTENVLMAQLRSYHADVIWTYNTQFELVNNTNTLSGDASQTTLGLERPDIQKIFANNHAAHFYEETPVGMMEIFASTVQPSDDQARQTPAKGYYFMGRVLDENYADELSANTLNNVSILPSLSIGTRSTDFSAEEGKIAFAKNLYDFDGAAVGQIYAEYQSATIGRVAESFNRLMLVTAIGYISLAFAVYIILGRLLIRPMRLVYDALLTGKTKHLDSLMQSKSEFGRIANLIVTSFKQRDEIAKVVTQKSATQEALEKRSEELEHTNRLMINRELRMIELKKEIAALKSKDDEKK